MEGAGIFLSGGYFGWWVDFVHPFPAGDSLKL
jgi:hypothetical protein